MGRSMSQGWADGMQDLRTSQAESDAFNSRLAANSATRAARRAEREVEELKAKLYIESGTLYATRSLLASLQKICTENLGGDSLESRRKAWLQGARGWINENATDAQKQQIRHACKSVSSVRWPDLYDLIAPPKPFATDPEQFRIGDITSAVVPSFFLFTKTNWIFDRKVYKSERLATEARSEVVRKHAENLDAAKAQFRTDAAAVAKWEADFSDCITF